METQTTSAPDTVLVVDDELFLRELCAEIIADEGYRVVSASDATEGLRIAAVPARADARPRSR